MEKEISVQWTILDDPVNVASVACDRIVQTSKQAIAERGKFQLVLAGGSTPEQTYLQLAKSECDWKNWHLWFGDERCLPVNHPDRNSSMVEKALYSKVPIPPEQVNAIRAELGSEQAALHYASLLEEIQIFDLVLSGMGEDGHTASLFPDCIQPEGVRVVPIHDAPKPPTERVSLSAEMLSRCRSMIIIITGKRKSLALSRWRQGANLPVRSIKGIEKTECLVDKVAWNDGN